MDEHETAVPALPGLRLPRGGGEEGEVAHLAVLRLLAENPQISQRELSSRLGVSLGKTHFVVHALLDKGLVKVRNFQRSQRKLAYAYVLTPSGLRAKLRLTQRFLKRKEEEYEALERTIAQLRHELAQQGPAPEAASAPNGTAAAAAATKPRRLAGTTGSEVRP